MRFFLPFALVLLAGCPGNTSDYCDPIVVSMNLTPNADGTYTQGPCATNDTVNNTLDYSTCCPEGYDYVAATAEGVLCEPECGMASAKSVQATSDAAFVAHAVTSATLNAVQALQSQP